MGRLHWRGTRGSPTRYPLCTKGGWGISPDDSPIAVGTLIHLTVAVTAMDDGADEAAFKSNDTLTQRKVFYADSYMLTHICFGVNFSFLLIHLVTLISFKKARHFYGVGYFLGQIFLSISALLTLVCCSLDIGNRSFAIILLTANFGYLVNLSAQTLSAIIGFIFSFQSDSSHRSIGCFRKTWVNAIALVCIFAVPLSMTIQQSFPVINKSTLLGSADSVGDSGATSAVRSQRVACSFVASTDTLYFLLTPAVLLLLVQFVVICVALRRWSTLDNLSKGMKRKQRLIALLKTCLGQLLVWGTALVALLTASNTLWNVFMLCTALQSIFSTMVCILSRSVVGAALASKYRSGGDITDYPNNVQHSINDDREMLDLCRYKLGDDSERFYR
ncbi:conserved hypothetical protein [Echinococcus multilocularis]|uniref:Transmembrane protein n=1 Tax=Echinococcus multilocularis TaxID=6211 RepID=A0A087VZU0_ECHMU|nr:conserved hypothetical protein [Echinococcus multilocularis]